MAGHSKWSKIKRQKGSTDAARGKVFTKMAREIMVAVKEGGSGDPEANARLRSAITRAKAAGVPNDNIDRAVQKGMGTWGDDSNFEDVQYEGYGPGGVAVLIETLTDNRNRTAGDVRSYFNKCDGNLGETGCVNWMFERKGMIVLDETPDMDELYLRASDAGAEDIKEDADPPEIITTVEDFDAVNAALENAYQIQSAELTYLPQNTVQITDLVIAKKLMKLLNLLEEHDDVQNVYSNFEMDDDILDTLGE